MLKLEFTTHYDHTGRKLFISHQNTTYIVPTYLNKSFYPCVETENLPTFIREYAQSLHCTSGLVTLVHRLVYALYTGTDLKCDRIAHTGVTVHHINRNRFNCEITNLQAMTYEQHTKEHDLGFITLDDEVQNV